MKHKKVALIGNPNVGKSTVFNALTGLHQHTGNWPGKTVENAYGECHFQDTLMTIYDLPGTYSLVSHSLEEQVASDFICFEQYDVAIVVCDAVCLERSLNLVFQTMEIIPNVVVCVNLMDEAKKKKIRINLKKLEECLGVPVVSTSAIRGEGLDELMRQVIQVDRKTYYPLIYPKYIEDYITLVTPFFEKFDYNPRFIALKLLSGDSIFSYLPEVNQEEIKSLLRFPRKIFREDDIVGTLLAESKKVCQEVVQFEDEKYDQSMRKWDKILTDKITGIPIMIFMLFVILWLTIRFSNIPSSLLFDFFAFIETKLTWLFNMLSFPWWLNGVLIEGVYRTLTWVISVMLPPMAIFFPLFTLLEDLGVLPRIAFNLDHPFEKCRACGKQSLTMCMGLGCNAVGVMGARIIDSKRERLLAILTNSFMPCNGRFPAMISMISMFFVGMSSQYSSVISSLFLTGIILLGIMMTFLVSYILSKTILKGYPSSFTLELPPYRRPQIGKVIIRSIFDRTLFVLGRAVSVAAPAGFVIWVVANVSIGGTTILSILANFFQPLGILLGLDGMILLAFFLGFPANEIVLPILMLGYLSLGSMMEVNDLVVMKGILVNQGWTILTAINFIILCLFHFPCSTTILTIKKETNSWKWAVIAFLLPTFIGFGLCLILRCLFLLF